MVGGGHWDWGRALPVLGGLMGFNALEAPPTSTFPSLLTSDRALPLCRETFSDAWPEGLVFGLGTRALLMMLAFLPRRSSLRLMERVEGGGLGDEGEGEVLRGRER